MFNVKAFNFNKIFQCHDHDDKLNKGKVFLPPFVRKTPNISPAEPKTQVIDFYI